MFDLVVVVTVSGQDVLYMSMNHSNTAEDWASGIIWTEMPFDASGMAVPSPLTISDVYLMTIINPDDKSQSGTLTCFVDPAALIKWVRHPCAIDLKAGSIDSCLGRRIGDRIPGSSGLYVFSPNSQYDGASGVLAVPNTNIGGVDMFANIVSLAAYMTESKTVVWALGQQGQLFYVDCVAGEEASLSAWSTPVPFSTNINQFAFFLNTTLANIILFAYASGQDILQFTYFTTRIALEDDNGSPALCQNINITSEVLVSVYINDKYYMLSPTVLVSIETDCAGSVTVIQETNTLAAVKIMAITDGSTPANSIVDPLANISAKLATIHTGDDLANIAIQADDGSQKPLLSNTVSSDNRDAAAQALTQLMQAKSSIEANLGSDSTANETGGSANISASPASSAKTQNNLTAASTDTTAAASATSSSAVKIDFLEHSVKNGMDSAQVTDPEQPSPDLSSVESLLSDLGTLLEDQMDDIETAVSQIKTEVINHFYDLTVIEIAKKILAIAADLVLKNAKHVIVTILEVFKPIIQGAFNMLESPLDIPILSQIYKLITGNELTFIDLICFVAAIPMTVMYKIAFDEAPFPDDASVQSLTGSGARNVINIPQPSSLSKPATASGASPSLLAKDSPVDSAVSPQAMMLSEVAIPLTGTVVLTGEASSKTTESSCPSQPAKISVIDKAKIAFGFATLPMSFILCYTNFKKSLSANLTWNFHHPPVGRGYVPQRPAGPA
ncbi:amidase 1 [Fusarium coicis]|nr:amidase 1 [Fusarium coicis]